MADPITALGAVGILSNFLQIADFTAGVVSKTREIVKSGTDAFRENIEIERLTRECGWLGDWILETSKQPVEQDESAVLSAAQQCVRESGRLLELLKSLKLSEGTRGIKRTFQGARRAVRAVRKREDVAAHEKMLDSLNGQLAIALLQVLRRKQVSFHEEVLNSMDSHAEHSLATVLSSKVEIMEVLRRQEASSSSMMHSQHSMLSQLSVRFDGDKIESEKAKKQRETRECAIVTSLKFSNMLFRKDAIPPTYRTTFEWIFSDQHRFKRWLEHEDGIFWISGKAGSGKSTLMKFISDHASTRRMLTTWAAPIKPHSLDFYFWYTGSELQKSQEGLLRCILHGVFKKCPALLPRVVPHRWDSLDPPNSVPDAWSRVEMSQALQTIAALSDPSHKFCLFLDGLDEYSGSHQALIADLRSLCRNTCIKICVSSRPWNVFVNAFGSLDTVLHLEELTANDIYEYATGHLVRTDLLQQDPGSDIDDLVSEIVLKSQGVFFWVFLVTRSLNEGLEEGDSTKILRRRLSEMSSDLEEFFKSLLARLNKTYRVETSQVLKLAMVSLGRTIVNDSLDNWLDFWILREFDFLDDNFAFKIETRIYDDSHITKMKKDAKAFINASCRDFLSVSTGGQTVNFLHRTVHEFLSGPKIRDMLDDHVPSILQSPQIMLHIRLARCKFLRWSDVNWQPFCYGALEPPDTLSCVEDYIFPGADALADAFGAAMSSMLATCKRFAKHGARECTLKLQCIQIFEFLAHHDKHEYEKVCPLPMELHASRPDRSGTLHKSSSVP